MTKGKVAVALSGGVDSSVAAFLLQEAGYEVVGVHAWLWDSPSSEQQEKRAENICHILNIPFYIIDLRKEFERYVVDYFCQEYQQGRTPNPCIACNQHIKFGFLLDKALFTDVDYFSTGHYAKIEHSDGGYHLLKAADSSKDQSYFLYTLNQEKLKHVLFPLGGYSKAEIKQIAKQAELPITAKASQDICFISEKNYRTFLSQRFLSTPGDVIDAQGKILGRHQGIPGYTVGQRHGLGLASGEPLYVIRMEPENNKVILGREKELYSHNVTTRPLSWITNNPPTEPITITAKIRYKSKEAEATIFPKGDSATILFPQPQRAVTPGQAIVFYRGNELLGGGIIESSQPMSF